MSTCGTLMVSVDVERAGSPLGLCEGEVPRGCLDRATVDIQLMFASGGVALTLAGWFAYFVILPTYVG